MITGHSKLFHPSVLFVGILLVWLQSIEVPRGSAQIHRKPGVADGRKSRIEENNTIERAMASICEERAKDKQGSIPIDRMAMQQAVPLTDPLVIARKKRAENLLPVAKRLIPIILSRFAADYDLEPMNSSWITTRIKAVNTIQAEVAAHDNAAWRPDEPHIIAIGTVFLVGLQSDEAIITVLAHELTHAINGTDQSLRELFRRVEARAWELSRMSIRGDMVAELTCEMVGIRVMQSHFGGASRKGGLRRLARALGKNCVQRDLADETHLSPRETMRMLLALEPETTEAVIRLEEKRAQPSKKRKPKHKLLPDAN